MMNENPGVYNEARNRLKEQKELEKRQLDNITDKFEKEKEFTRTQKKFDIFELRHKIEVGNSLNSLRRDIDKALKEGLISREAFDTLEKRIDVVAKDPEKFPGKIRSKNISDEEFSKNLPLGHLELTQFFENKKIWDNFLIDFAGFAYGFFIQWSAILIILLYKIFIDFLFLPRDIIHELKK